MKFIFTALIATVLLPSIAVADIIIGSWNIQSLGWDNNNRYDKVANIASHFDILLIQKLMNEHALKRFEAELEAVSGESWSSMASHALERSTCRQHYGFLWRDLSAFYDNGAGVYIDSRDVFACEPFLAQFHSDLSSQTFALANVHITYGSSIGDRLPEIEALASYWQWQEEVYPGAPSTLAGDFNLPPPHEGWVPLREAVAILVITNGATTLGLSDGVWSNLYDNIWKTPGQLAATYHGIVQFPKLIKANHVTARGIISDHASVWIALGGAELQLTEFDDRVYDAANDPVYCIGLNDTIVDQLAELPNVGPACTAQIIDMRPWDGARSLTRVSGLGPQA